jgi:hypothetical protein
MKIFIQSIGQGFKWAWMANSIAWKNFGPFGYKLLVGKNIQENNVKFIDMFIDRINKTEA